MFAKLHAYLEQDLQSLAKTEKPSGIPNLEKYIGTSYLFYGIRMPSLRKLFRTFRNHHLLPPETELSFWNEVWNCRQSYEAMMMALYYAEWAAKKKNVQENFRETILHWVHYVDNWAHSDLLSGVYSVFYQEDPERIFKLMTVWNSDPNFWLRRQSLVTLIPRRTGRSNKPEWRDVQVLIENRMDDTEYYVAKAVGWAVREFSLQSPEILLPWIYSNAVSFHPASWTAVTEKLTPEHRYELKQIREKDRRRK
jgi:3-methyladenine DNA glycosylase AlkD